MIKCNICKKQIKPSGIIREMNGYWDAEKSKLKSGMYLCRSCFYRRDRFQHLIYLLYSKSTSTYKIGKTTDINARVKGINNIKNAPSDFEILELFALNIENEEKPEVLNIKLHRLESKIHHYFSKYKKGNEYYNKELREKLITENFNDICKEQERGLDLFSFNKKAP